MLSYNELNRSQRSPPRVSWIVIPFLALSCSFVMTACSQRHYRAGDCFAMRGTGSQGRVLEAEHPFYVIELGSTESRNQWTVPQNQLDRDARAGDCPPDVFTTVTR